MSANKGQVKMMLTEIYDLKNKITTDTQNPSETHIKQSFFPTYLKKRMEQVDHFSEKLCLCY